MNKDLEDIETRHMRQMTHLQKLYLEGEIKTGEEYTALQIDLEKKFLGEKLAVVGLEAHEREKLQVKSWNHKLNFMKVVKNKMKKPKKTGKK